MILEAMAMKFDGLHLFSLAVGILIGWMLASKKKTGTWF